MSTKIMERKATIRELVCGAFEVDLDEVTAETMFVDDLGVDSLGVIDLLASLEVCFGVRIEPDELPRMVNLDGVYEVVAEAAGWPADDATVRR